MADEGQFFEMAVLQYGRTAQKIFFELRDGAVSVPSSYKVMCLANRKQGSLGETLGEYWLVPAQPKRIDKPPHRQPEPIVSETLPDVKIWWIEDFTI